MRSSPPTSVGTHQHVCVCVCGMPVSKYLTMWVKFGEPPPPRKLGPSPAVPSTEGYVAICPGLWNGSTSCVWLASEMARRLRHRSRSSRRRAPRLPCGQADLHQDNRRSTPRGVGPSVTAKLNLHDAHRCIRVFPGPCWPQQYNFIIHKLFLGSAGTQVLTWLQRVYTGLGRACS